MITTLTLNPCLDLTLEFPTLELGSYNAYTASREDYCSKGINVSIALTNLGAKSMCTGINFHGNGKQLEELLDSLGIPYRFTMTEGNIRLNIKAYDMSKNQMTELNAVGVAVPDAVIEECLNTTVECAEDGGILVLSGRTTRDASQDIYRRITSAVAHRPVKVVVDASGDLMREAVKAKPFLIKPNTYELETTFGCKIDSKQDAVVACRTIIDMGVQVVCVSMGKEGAMIVDAQHAYFAPTLDVEVKGFQGAGDSMVAGICLAAQEGKGIDDMLRYGTAASHASIIREGTLLCQRPDFERFLEQVQLQQM